MADHRRVIFTMAVLGVLGMGLLFFSQRVLKPKESPIQPEYLTQKISNLSETDVQKVSADELIGILAQSKHKLTLVNLWATWCGPCKEEIPELVLLQKKMEKKNVNVALVSVDGFDLLPEVHKTLFDLKVDFLTFIRTDEDKVFIEKMFPGWSGALPASMIFDQNGKFKQGWMGTKTLKEFEVELTKHL